MLITLTTDFGEKSYRKAALKGAVLSRCATARFVDVSHRVEPFDIVEAAFLVKNVWRSFPEQTIHIVAVHNFYDRNFRFIAAERDGHVFLAPDNGVLSLVFDDIKAEALRALEMPQADGHDYFLREIFASAIGHLAAGQRFSSLGSSVERFEQRIHFQPVTSPNGIRGAIIHIDDFENAVLNISRSLFEKVGRGRSFSLFFKRNDPISELSKHYSDAEIGEPLCLFNSAGLLEIAVNTGRAASLLNLKKDDVVHIDFH